MYHLNVSIPLARPQYDAYARLETLFATYAPGGNMRFTLRAPLEVPGLHVGMTLHRDVIANVSPFGENRRAYTIAWQPAEPGPFPSFAGAVFVGHDEDAEERSVLTLDGHYDAPFNIAGDVFDATVGKHIAEACARDLASRLATFLDVETREPLTLA